MTQCGHVKCMQGGTQFDITVFYKHQKTLCHQFQCYLDTSKEPDEGIKSVSRFIDLKVKRFKLKCYHCGKKAQHGCFRYTREQYAEGFQEALEAIAVCNNGDCIRLLRKYVITRANKRIGIETCATCGKSTEAVQCQVCHMAHLCPSTTCALAHYDDCF